jgi:hypothetical protein
MTDHNTWQRQGELNAWQRASINQILGASAPLINASTMWHVLETLMAWVGMFWLGVVCLWCAAALLGFYFEMAASGFAFGRGVLAWLWEVSR